MSEFRETQTLRERLVNLPVCLYPDQVDEICKGCMAWFREEIEKLEPLSPFQLEEVYEKAYNNACAFSEEYPSGLSSEHWMPTRQGDRLRYFNETERDTIQEHTSRAQLDDIKRQLKEMIQ